MARHTRINAIIELLRQSPQTVESIAQYFDNKLSPRQIRGDIEAIKALGYDNKDFEKTGVANRKTWQIKQETYQTNTYRLVRGTLPQVFALKRQQELEKLNNWSSMDTNPIVESTHFYETVARQALDNSLEKVIQAIDSGRKLWLQKLNGDATSVTSSVSFPLIILPVKIIYHRGCFYLAAIADESQKVLTFQIDHMIFEEVSATFDRTSIIDLVENDLKNRFGITQNIDGDVYTIELRFSSTTGYFVKSQFWLDTIGDPVRIGDDWLFTFRCGINRELVGWLFQWMSNVKVIGPPKLKKLYDEQLIRMLDITNQPADKPVAYTNIFAPNLS